MCACDPVGAVEEICDKTIGECLCKDSFNGDRCDTCARGFWGYPDCKGKSVWEMPGIGLLVSELLFIR